MNILIGSRALSHWNNHLPSENQKDWDIISDNQVNCCDIQSLSLVNNKEMLKYASDSVVRLPDGNSAFVMSKLGLAIIKRSHLWRDFKFESHIAQFYKQGLADCLRANMNSAVLRDLQQRTKMTMLLYPQANPNLMQSKEAFFDDAVSKVYDHDYLHELYAHYDKPLYTQLLRQEGNAWCEKDKWLLLSHDDKLKCIQEEAYVIATERFLVRNNWDYPMKLAYLKALGKICTTLCSNWFRDYAIDHYPELVQNYDENKILKTKAILES